jgi:tetratricopeptide (TPR) repeat protein
MPLLTICGLATVLALQPSAPARSPYLDVVRGYGPGTEAASVAALAALRVADADAVLDHLDRRVCASAGARGCAWKDRQAAGVDIARRIQAAWRHLYPRALALHVEALAAADLLARDNATEDHRVIVHALIRRIDEIAAEHGMAPGFASFATRGRHLLVWVLQFRRDESALERTLATLDDAGMPARDVELALAGGALAELRTMPESVGASPRIDAFAAPLPREVRIAAEEARRRAGAVRTYEEVLARHPGTLEAHLRLARLLGRQGRLDAAQAHLRRVAVLEPDSRQVYLMHLFLADLHESRGQRGAAIAAYTAAQAAWPGAQSPAIAAARLHALAGDPAAVAAALARVDRGRDPRERSDPWHGYNGGQAWKLPAGMAALQASFEPQP